jgi:hypothetical protein
MTTTITEKVLAAAVFVGLAASIVITFKHLATGNERTYDNWLLPVFLAVALQLYINQKK